MECHYILTWTKFRWKRHVTTITRHPPCLNRLGCFRWRDLCKTFQRHWRSPFRGVTTSSQFVVTAIRVRRTSVCDFLSWKGDPRTRIHKYQNIQCRFSLFLCPLLLLQVSFVGWHVSVTKPFWIYPEIKKCPPFLFLRQSSPNMVLFHFTHLSTHSRWNPFNRGESKGFTRPPWPTRTPRKVRNIRHKPLLVLRWSCLINAPRYTHRRGFPSSIVPSSRSPTGPLSLSRVGSSRPGIVAREYSPSMYMCHTGTLLDSFPPLSHGTPTQNLSSHHLFPLSLLFETKPWGLLIPVPYGRFMCTCCKCRLWESRV